MKVAKLVIIAIIILVICYFAGYKIGKMIGGKDEVTNETVENTIEEVKETASEVLNEAVENVVEEIEEEKEEPAELTYGKFLVAEPSEDDAGISNKDCGLTVNKNKNFSFYLNWGASIFGTYTIDGNTLTCTATDWRGEEGGATHEYISSTLTFEIVDKDTIKLTDIKYGSSRDEQLIYIDGLEVGWEYKIKE